MKSKRSLITLTIIFNLVVLISPLFTFDKVQDEYELSKSSFGFLIPYVVQNMSQLDPPFPYNITLSSPWEYHTTINLGAFISSAVIATVIAVLLHMIFGLVNKRYLIK